MGDLLATLARANLKALHKERARAFNLLADECKAALNRQGGAHWREYNVQLHCMLGSCQRAASSSRLGLVSAAPGRVRATTGHLEPSPPHIVCWCRVLCSAGLLCGKPVRSLDSRLRDRGGPTHASLVEPCLAHPRSCRHRSCGTVLAEQQPCTWPAPSSPPGVRKVAQWALAISAQGRPARTARKWLPCAHQDSKMHQGHLLATARFKSVT